jgi:PAS domain S-box-containing protein
VKEQSPIPNDATEEERLAQLLEKFESQRELVRSLLDAYLLLDANGRIVKFNQAFCTMLDLGPSEVRRAGGVSDLFSSAIHGSEKSGMTLVMEARDVVRIDEVNASRGHDGRAMRLTLGGCPYFDSRGEFLGVLVLLRDLTAESNLHSKYLQQAIQSQVARLEQDWFRRFLEALTLRIQKGEAVAIPQLHGNDMWNRYAENLVQLVEELTEERAELHKQAAIAQTTQMLAHDVRRPFLLLKMTLELLGKVRTQEQMEKVLKTAMTDVSRAMVSVNGLIQDIMEIDSRSQLNCEPVQVDSLVHAALTDTFRIYPKADVAIEYSLAHAHAVNIDSARVMRVFLNILGNAVQAMGGQGTISIRTEASGHQTHFVLGNSGPPIEKSDLSRLFDAFFTRDKKGGTGLGLAIAKKVVLEHGGKIWCESAPGCGVEFHLTLPNAEVVATRSLDLPDHSRKVVAVAQPFPALTSLGNDEGDDFALLVALAMERLAVLGRPLRLLIVDDEALYRNGIVAHIATIAELVPFVAIATAHDATTALAALEASPPPDLVILDVNLGDGGRNGFDVMVQIRQSGLKTYACLHTNRVLLEDNRAALESGADLFLPKPMARFHLMKLLVQTVDKIL